MERTKEADLVTAVLIYAMRCLAEGDHAALRDLHFGVKEIEALREMQVADLYRIGTLRTHKPCARCRLRISTGSGPCARIVLRSRSTGRCTGR